jgi:2'-5' RNA ligase
MPPHVTVLFPFLDLEALDAGVREDLAAIAAAAPAFDVALRGTGRFPNVLYLMPDRAAPFVQLTRAVEARWPDHPPYGGAYDAVIPHLTVCQGEQPPGLEQQVQALLPVHARAAELWLMAEQRDGSWERDTSFALGAGAG